MTTTRLRNALAAGLFLLLLLPSVRGEAALDIEQWTSDHGLDVYFVRTDALPMVDMHLTVDAGSARDGDLPGLARMTSNLLAEGADGRSAGDIARAFEDRGARFSTSSGRDSAQVTLRTLNAPDTLSRAVAVMARVIGHPDFPDDAVERERQRMRVGLQQAERDPGSIARRAFWEALYGDHPYASPPEGTESAIDSIDREAIADFHARHYVRQNATLTIVGDLSRAEAEQIALHLGEAMKTGEPAPAIADAPMPSEPETIRIEAPSSQTVIMTGHVGYRRGDERHFDLYVANHILGGSGLVSRLGVAMREDRGLSYGVSSSFRPMVAAGPFAIRTQVRNDRTEEALEVITDHLGDLRAEGPTADELDDAIRNISGSFPLSLDSNSNIAGFVSTIAFHDLPLDYADHFLQRIEEVSAESVRQAANSGLQPDRLTTVIVGPEAEDQER